MAYHQLVEGSDVDTLLGSDDAPSSTLSKASRSKASINSGSDTQDNTSSYPLMTTANTIRNDTSRTRTVDIADQRSENSRNSVTTLHSYTRAPKRKTRGFAPLEKPDYPPSMSETLVSRPSSWKARAPPIHSTKPHTPIAATVLFARGAPRLHLPKLDAYISTLEQPTFLQKGSRWEKDKMFPPMDKLAASGRSIEDLETNSQVAPPWRNRQTILGTAVNTVLGFTGSSALAAFYSLQGLANTLQIFALILSTVVPLFGNDILNQWHQLLLGTIPNIIAMNFASSVIQSLILLVIFLTLSSGLLYYFYRSTRHCDRYNRVEGLQQTAPEGKQWALLVVTFFLTVLYLPLSTMAVHVLVWSDDLWVVANPYKNATVLPPKLHPLGPPSVYRDPLDFCWTTTMKRNEINFAPVIVILSILVLLSLTIWFPIALRNVVRQSVPKVDMYTGLGRRRNQADLDGEYHRLLARDQNPFSFLYSGYRRGWATYQSTFLFAKLSTLVIIAIIDPDNCFFRSLPRNPVPIVRQILLLVSTTGFFLAQCFFAPFLDPVNNASEWTSRLNYVATSIVALLLALDIPGKQIYNVYVLYVIYVVTYGLSFYFTVINTSLIRRAVKRLTKRVDFSIDIFSPALDLSFPSPHTKRRIWQETITALLLTSPDCQIPAKQRIAYAQARDSEFPPYLLNFAGTPGERHAENLKILREIGGFAYNRAAALLSGPDREWFKQLEAEIQTKFIGPDSFWRNEKNPDSRCTNFFGNAWWIPFPPTLVLRYDDGPYVVLQDLVDLQKYIAQNESPDICRRRQVRMSLRALEGQIVQWPYDHISPVGSHSPLSWGKGKYTARSSVHYETCKLNISRHGHLEWEGYQFGSGFEVVLSYAKKLDLDGSVIGLTKDFDLTTPMARFLSLNRKLISSRLGDVELALSHYRQHHRQECHSKIDALTYRFMAYVFDNPQEPKGLTQSSITSERDPRVQNLMSGSEEVFSAAYARFCAASSSETATWWYIFWDDLWRRNHDTISALELHATDFNPSYPNSIAYTPLPRPALESLLLQRGLLSKSGGDFFHSGFLNKLYLRLNETAFRGSNRAIMFHVGDDKYDELDMEDLDLETLVQPSTMGTLGTGGGTDHDDVSIRARPTYKWEGLLSDPIHSSPRIKFLAKLGAWMGVTPLWRSGSLSQGLSVDVRLENGRYVLTDDDSTLGGSSYMESWKQ